jgi:hypothetical protein
LASIASSGQLNIDPLRIVPDQVKAKCIPINGLRPSRPAKRRLQMQLNTQGGRRRPECFIR